MVVKPATTLDAIWPSSVRFYETMANPALTKITSNFQITMPKAARDALSLKRGDFLEATVEHGAVVLRPKVLQDRDGVLAAERARAGIGVSRAYDDPEEFVADLHAAARRVKTRQRRAR